MVHEEGCGGAPTGEAASPEHPQLLDLVRDAIMVLDGASGAIRYWNRGAAELYGWSRAEAVGRGAEALLRGAGAPTGDCLSAARQSGSWEGELLQTARDGTTRIVASRWVRRRDERGEVVLRLDTDITAQKREVERLGELAAMKADFTAMVAHELFGPLAAIQRLADALATGALAPKVQSDVIAAVRGEANLLATLAADIRTSAVVEGADFAVHPRATPLAVILSAAAAYADTLPGEHPLTVESAVPTGTIVRADPDRIGQVLRNLLNNAAKYSPDGAPIALRAGDGPAPGSITIAVADQGRGIAPAELARIFEKFGRGRDDGGRRIPGVGLGLYISRRIVRGHGGDLTVASAPGRGSTFSFALPTEP